MLHFTLASRWAARRRATDRTPGRRVRLLLIALVAGFVTTGVALTTATGPASAASDPCGAGGNKITCENSKPGTDPSVWDITKSGDDEIQGFSTDISVNVGQRIDFKIDTDAAAYTVTIFRMGYYQGLGARQIATVAPSAPLPQHQPQCITDLTTELYDCGNWAVSASWNVPSTAVSGVYIALLKDPATGDASHITFIVRDDSSTSPVLFQTSDPTWQAYNTYGGSDFYQGGDHGRAYKISYNRPVLTRSGTGGRDFFMSNEYPAIRFLERNGYDVSYMAGVDTDRYGSLLTNHKVFMSVGHDEYWSKGQRANVTAARDAGVNLMFLSGNEVYWKTRYEDSADSSHTAYRTLVSYKETWGNAKIDPSTEWTGTWRDPRFAPPSAGGASPENGLTGQMYMSNDTDLAMQVNATEGKLRLWRNTSLATMSSGTATLAPHTVGYESDEDLDNGYRPPGTVDLSTTTGASPQYLRDFGNVTSPGTTTHHLTLYKAASGALVFAAGTIQWTWGLDEEHDSPYAAEPADPRMQQAQVNLFADMGVQPATLMTGLVAATRSTDTVGPTTTISAPAAGASVANGTKVTLTGTAADAGGRVAGVEVSTDGASWHPATGTTSWSYSYLQKGTGSQTVRVRAVDDSANIGAVVSRAFTVGCPCSVYGNEVPTVPASDDASGTELGLRFTATTDGFVSGVRFYKGTGNTGTHVGTLWSAGGSKLATVTFAGESATGWQSAAFTNAVAVTAGQSYVVSYTAPAGRYAAQPWAFGYTGVDAGPLTVAGGFSAASAGTYGSAGAFPDQSFQKTNYYVDPVFNLTDTSPLVAINQSPADGTGSVSTSATPSARFSKPVVASSVTAAVKTAGGSAVAGTTAYDATTRTVTFTPSAALPASTQLTVTLGATDTTGGVLTTGKSWSFTTGALSNPPGVCPCTLFDESLTPTQPEDSDTAAVTLGVRFTADVNGTVSAVKFYKGPNNTGSHTGTLWAGDGTKLAEGTFANETTNGWQTLTFATPVAITKNATYYASYRAPGGRYSASPGAFADADLSRAPLHVTSTSGAYTYGSGYPASTSSANYLVDVVFQKTTPTISITSRDPAPSATDVGRGTTVKVGFSTTIQPSGWSMTANAGGAAVAGTVSLNTAATQLTFTPSTQLPASATVTVSLSGVTSTDGATLATTAWSFVTRSSGTASSQSLFSDTVPDTPATDDSSAVELGVAFTPAKNGTVSALRFYKGAGNGGTHTASLWTAGGSRLATVTFTGETASGWQTATLSSPVSVTAGTTYVASYFAPQGHYAHTANFFGSGWSSGDLSAPSANNGRYVYGSAGGFPASSYQASNYFVDVVFTPAAATIAVTAQSPVSGATGVSRTATPSATFSAAVAPGWSMTLKQGTTSVAGSAALSADQRKLTFTPSAPLPADADITVALANVTSTDGAALPDQSWTFHTDASATATSSLFSGVTPATAAVNDNDAVQLGVAFSSSVAGQVSGIRFYKGTGNTGTHTGSLWDSGGNRLATVTFTGETATGWQTATLATPVTITPGQQYVVSYYAPSGHYAATGAFFGSAWSSGPLTAGSGTNGRYRYGVGGGLPTSSYNATNYFVDVVFAAS